ncbi:MAG: 2-amino-4-hydroxy-6-hydroxymethyldihydropteridine diphosphokinase, partial [Anaerolineae bacterium]
RHLRRAAMALNPVVTVQTVSPVYQTKPWGPVPQPDFLNICLTGTTRLAPLPLLKHIKSLETMLGRQPGLRWGPRLIDIDILFYNTLIIQHRQLTLPHPRLPERAFVLAPLADIAPDLTHPQTGLSVAQMLQAIGLDEVCRLPDPLFDQRPV